MYILCICIYIYCAKLLPPGDSAPKASTIRTKVDRMLLSSTFIARGCSYRAGPPIAPSAGLAST